MNKRDKNPEGLYQEMNPNIASTILKIICDQADGNVNLKVIQWATKGQSTANHLTQDSEGLVDFLEGWRILILLLLWAYFEKLFEVLAESAQGSFSRESFSTLTRPLLIPLVKQEKFCASFCGKSLDLHLQVQFINF